MLDNIQDTFSEYRDYLVDASDTISHALSKIKDLIGDRVRK